MSVKSSEHSDMSDVALAAKLIREVVSVDAGATIGERILKASRKLGWTYYRTRDVWREQARRIDAFEMDQLRAGKISCQIQEARRAYAELTQYIAGMEAALAHMDENFHGPTLDALRHIRSQAAQTDGGIHRAGTKGRGE